MTKRNESAEDELIIAHKRIAFQIEENEKLMAELIIAQNELACQKEEKGKRTAELSIANKELLAFTYINTADHKFKRKELAIIVEEVKTELKDTIEEIHATIKVYKLCRDNIITFQFRQLMFNLISNALKFSKPDIPSYITIKSRIVKGNNLNIEKLSPVKKYCHITVKDDGIGFEPHFSERIFEVFQKLHGKDIYGGTGIGLSIVKKIVENHKGIIIATSELNKGAQFDIYIPA